VVSHCRFARACEGEVSPEYGGLGPGLGLAAAGVGVRHASVVGEGIQVLLHVTDTVGVIERMSRLVNKDLGTVLSKIDTAVTHSVSAVSFGLGRDLVDRGSDG